MTNIVNIYSRALVIRPVSMHALITSSHGGGINTFWIIIIIIITNEWIFKLIFTINDTVLLIYCKVADIDHMWLERECLTSFTILEFMIKLI